MTLRAGITLLALTFGLALTAAYLTSIRTHEDWEMQVAYEDLPQVSGIVISDGAVYVSLEKRNFNGEIRRLQNGNQESIISHLQKPDGLAIYQNTLIYTQESAGFPVRSFDGHIDRELFAMSEGEGIAVNKSGQILTLEDRPDGRLLRYDPKTDQLDTLFSDLQEAEGVCFGESEKIYYTERNLGKIYRVIGAMREEVISDLQQPGFIYCDETTPGLWVTEDRTNFGRLLYFATDSSLPVVIAEGLASPQSIAFEPGGGMLLAEQGRDRIIRLTRINRGTSHQVEH